jgi:hypothetical protein
MKPILTRCGYRCDLCLAYKLNVERNPENRRTLSDGWHRYFGFRLPPADICCDGCMSEDSHLIDQGCPVRPCVIKRRLENCSQCQEYVCDKLRRRLVTYEGVAERVSSEIDQDDRERFIRPYENKERLDALRAAELG